MNQKFYWITGAFFAFGAVIAEALGAHALAAVSESGQENYRTATLFLLFHGVVMLVVPFYLEKNASGLLRTSTAIIAGSSLVFSSTIIIKVFLHDPWWGFITPVGGGILILGWLLFLIAAALSRN